MIIIGNLTCFYCQKEIELSSEMKCDCNKDNLYHFLIASDDRTLQFAKTISGKYIIYHAGKYLLHAGMENNLNKWNEIINEIQRFAKLRSFI